MNPPKAQRYPHPHQIHGDIRQDDYYWLREKENPEVIQYLTEENRYFEEMMQPLRGLQETLYREMIEHIPEAEEEMPAQDGPYFYYSRINPGQQYRTYYRKQAVHRDELPHSAEEIILDVNALATDGFLSVTTVLVSPSHDRLAYLENRDGTDRYTLFVKDLTTGELVDSPIPNVYIGGSIAWDKESQYLFYITIDMSQRPNQLWRHRLLSPEPDILLFEETDITFTLNLHTSKSGDYLFLVSDTKITSEVYYLPSNTPEEPFQLFSPRRRNILYMIEHWHEHFLILTNDGAENFTLLTVPIAEPTLAKAAPLFPYNHKRYLQEVIPFQDALLIYGREEGLTQLWTYQEDTLHRLSWEEPLYTVAPGHNISYTAQEMLISFSSLVTPKIHYALDLTTGKRTILYQEPIGHYDQDQYLQKQLWATAEDGTPIPLSLVAKKSFWGQTPRPLILYGYGSYGANSNPAFDATRLPLLDRGVIYVIAHVRGGSEMGESWYQNGKLFKKRNTFTDFVDAARYLIGEGYTTPQLLAARGRSAGGLLMGAVLNLAPELFQVVVPGVPFVDVLTTMLDASIPLTSLEWDEWGNPAEPEYYHYMKSYSPYDNVEEKAYPHLLIYTGLNDPRVGYFEPAKWVARLRVMKTDQHQLLLKTHMGAGHGGSSGRFARLNEVAEEYAFILDKLGISQ